MPSYIVKINKEDDFYVYWSDIVEAPHCWGTKAEVSDYIKRIWDDTSFGRFERADAYGSSAYSWADTYGWDDSGFIYKQLGFLKRAKLGEFLASFNKEENEFDLALLEPFDDCC